MSKLDTKFADMPAGVRARWLAWANSHDWGGDKPAHFEGDNLVTYAQEVECFVGNNTVWHVARATHSTPREMRDWAGY